MSECILVFVHMHTDYTILYSLRMWWPAWVSLMSVVHISDPCAEEKPKAVDGEEDTAQHDDDDGYTVLHVDGARLVCDKRKNKLAFEGLVTVPMRLSLTGWSTYTCVASRQRSTLHM